MKLKTQAFRKSIYKMWILCLNNLFSHRKVVFLYFLFVSVIQPWQADGQTVVQKIQKAYSVFEKDPQLKYAISSLYVVDANTGKVVFDKNSRIGLAPASTQKIITSVTAYELLGKDYTYNTNFYLSSMERPANLIIEPSGDPTLGSWRWSSTNDKEILSRLSTAIRNFISYPGVNESLIFLSNGWNYESIPDGWIWQDLANYYGAGARHFNWRENQFDIFLRSGSEIGDSVEIVESSIHSSKIRSLATSAAKGTGDNAYIYYDISETKKFYDFNESKQMVVRGTIPVNEKKFSISGAIPSPQTEFTIQLSYLLNTSKIFSWPGFIEIPKYELSTLRKIHTEQSPPLDTIIYWFNQRSINLYGEALVKTMAFKKYGIGMTDSGVSVIKDFWKSKKIDENELNISDGSGLSPQNRVTTHAQVEILKFARSRPWFSSFYHSLPVFNKMKLKSGTINKVKAFAGYHKSATGKEYIISFIVNNYNGSASTLVTKMYKVLDTLK